MAERDVQIRVSVDDLDANARLDKLSEKLHKLTDRTWTLKIGFDDGALSARLDRIAAKLDELGKKVVKPDIGTEGLAKANAELDKFNAKLDRINRRRVEANVSVSQDNNTIRRAIQRDADRLAGGPLGELRPVRDNTPGSTSWLIGSLLGNLKRGTSRHGWRGLFRGIFGAGGSAAGGAAGGAGTAGGAAAGASAGGIGDFLMSPVAAGLMAALLGPVSSLIDVAGGMGAGVLGAGGAVGITALDDKAMLAPGLTNIEKTISTVAQSIAPSIGMMFASFGKFVQGMAPDLAKFFAASLPFIRQFLILLEQAAKTVLPAFTQMMKEMVSSGSLKIFSEGLLILIKGFTEFMTALGPGFKAGAETFRAIAMGISGLLDGLGHAFGWLGKVTGEAYTEIHHWWDQLRHNTAVIFDGIRHDVAHYWDMIYADTIGKVVTIYRGVDKWEQNLRHDIANIFDGIRHDLATAWDNIWTDTKNVVTNGINAVVNFFQKLPGRALGVLKGFGSSLYNLGKTALNDMWSGLKSVGTSILGWLRNFIGGIPHAIMSFLHMSPPHPGSAFFDLGANFMHHLESGIKSRANHVMGALHGAIGGPSGGSAGAAAAYGRKLAAAYGWGGQWGAINSVAMRESGWSMVARNPTSGAYGIAQFIQGPSEYYQYGGNPNTIAGQVTAFYNYIKQRYGDPNAAWAHEVNYGWYDKGGVLKPGITMALNATGHDEYITNPHTYGAGGRGGDVYNIYPPDSATDPDAYGKAVVQAIRRYKIHKGNAVLGIA